MYRRTHTLRAAGSRATNSRAQQPPRSLRGLKTAAVAEQAYPVPLDQQRRAQARIAQIDAAKGVSPYLVDSFARQHNYLRISLTERCNLRCFYCMPSEGIELSPAGHLLTDEEVVRLAGLFVRNGVTKIRLTGGEPTVRKGLVDIVARLHALRAHGLESIGVTSNGIALHRKLPELIANGLTHLNLSLDTLDPFKFEIMTRRPGHEAVLRALDTALASSLRSVKLNVVVIKGLNDHEVFDFVEMTKDKPLSVRFIEFMPFTGNKWDKAKMLPSSELLSRIQSRYPTLTKASDEHNDTARNYLIPGHRGRIGFISSMSDHFCGTCNRLRLTADGQIKVCLFDPKEISLRDAMRRGAPDGELLATIGAAVHGKKAKHAGMEDIDTVTNRPMILIGGPRRAHVDPRAPPRALLAAAAHPIPRSTHQLRHKHTSAAPPQLTHIDAAGRPAMVDVSPKAPSVRTATASGRIFLPRVAFDLLSPSPSSTPNPQAEGEEGEGKLEKAKRKARAKGDVLAVAQLAAIMASKRTAELVPLCHPLALSHVSVRLYPEETRSAPRGPLAGAPTAQPPIPETHPQTHPQTHSQTQTGKGEDGEQQAQTASEDVVLSVRCVASVTCEGKTGVEMEALTAVSVGLLTVWDMLKAVAGREMVIGEIAVVEKTGGKSGDFVREDITL